MRLFSRGGHGFTRRYPWIVEAARKIKRSQFVLDGEAVMLGVNGISDFDALHSGRHNDEAQLYAFDILALSDDDLRQFSLSIRRQTPNRCCIAGRKLSSRPHSSVARLARTSSWRRAAWALKAWHPSKWPTFSSSYARRFAASSTAPEEAKTIAMLTVWRSAAESTQLPGHPVLALMPFAFDRFFAAIPVSL